MANRAGLPIDGNSRTVQLVPPVTALVVTVDNTISSATDLTLNTSTTFIEVTALNAGIYLRYAATASATNFDEYILANSTRHFYVPTGVTIISVIEDATTGTGAVRIIEKK